MPRISIEVVQSSPIDVVCDMMVHLLGNKIVDDFNLPQELKDKCGPDIEENITKIDEVLARRQLNIGAAITLETIGEANMNYICCTTTPIKRNKNNVKEKTNDHEHQRRIAYFAVLEEADECKCTNIALPIFNHSPNEESNTYCLSALQNVFYYFETHPDTTIKTIKFCVENEKTSTIISTLLNSSGSEFSIDDVEKERKRLELEHNANPHGYFYEPYNIEVLNFVYKPTAVGLKRIQVDIESLKKVKSYVKSKLEEIKSGEFQLADRREILGAYLKPKKLGKRNKFRDYGEEKRRRLELNEAVKKEEVEEEVKEPRPLRQAASDAQQKWKEVISEMRLNL